MTFNTGALPACVLGAWRARPPRHSTVEEP